MRVTTTTIVAIPLFGALVAGLILSNCRSEVPVTNPVITPGTATASATATPPPPLPMTAPAPTAIVGVPTAAAPGETAPLGQRPGPTPTPSAVFYRRDPFGPARVEAGQALRVQLGRLEAGTLVRAVLTVRFNSPLSGVLGAEPDVDVIPLGPSGPLREEFRRARSGTPISFQTTAAGEHAIELSNTYSRVNAKLAQLTFLQP